MPSKIVKLVAIVRDTTSLHRQAVTPPPPTQISHILSSLQNLTD
jgi:hypothetical protein